MRPSPPPGALSQGRRSIFQPRELGIREGRAGGGGGGVGETGTQTISWFPQVAELRVGFAPLGIVLGLVSRKVTKNPAHYAGVANPRDTLLWVSPAHMLC